MQFDLLLTFIYLFPLYFRNIFTFILGWDLLVTFPV